MSRKKEDAGSRKQVRGRPAVGYVRVSTQGQGENGISLQVQREAIETFSQSMGYQLIDIWEDVASGMGPKSFYNRPGLKSALEAANRENALVIVWAWDRLSRYPGIQNQIKKIIPDLNRVICARKGNRMNDASKAATLKHSETTGKEISARTKAGMAKRRAEGSVFGNPNIKASVQPLGSEAYSRRADELVRQVADVLSEFDDPFSVACSSVAAKLNEQGIRTLQSKEWTSSRVREPVRKARLLLEELEAPEPLATFGMF